MAQSANTYVLCEFINEDIRDKNNDTVKPCGVGHSEWIINDAPVGCESLSISEIIEKRIIVRMKWPNNHSVNTREKMAKLKKIEWNKNVLTYIRSEKKEWTRINEALKNYMKYGNPSPTKEERKTLQTVRDDLSAAKQGEEQPSSSNQVQNSKKKLFKTNSSDLAIETAVLDDTKKRKTNLKRKEILVDSSDSEDDKPLRPKTKIPRTDEEDDKEVFPEARKKVLTSLELSSSDDDPESPMDKPTFKRGEESGEVRRLQDKIKILKQELEIYKGMKSIVEYFSEAAAGLKKLIKKGKCPKCNTTKSIETEDIPKTESKTNSIEKYLQNVKQSSLSSQENKMATDNKSVSSFTPMESKVEYDDVLFEATTEHTKQSDHQDQDVRALKPITNHEMGKDQSTIMFGSKCLSIKHVKSVRHSKPTILAAELTALVFTAEEMALSTMKGKKTNAHPTAFQKKPIDEERVASIIDYVCKHFNKRKTEIEEELKNAIKAKLNNFSSKSEEGKKIVAIFRAKQLQNMSAAANLEMNKVASAAENSEIMTTAKEDEQTNS